MIEVKRVVLGMGRSGKREQCSIRTDGWRRELGRHHRDTETPTED